jgi:hypothetical protein
MSLSSNAVPIAIITLSEPVLAALISASAALFIGWMNARLNRIAAVGKATHALVNSAMGTQLLLTATVTKRLSDITHYPEDIQASELAAKLLSEHDAKQKKADQS